MQKKWFNQLKIKNTNMLKNAYFAYLSLILSWLNHFFCILKLVESLFLHIWVGLTKSFGFFDFEFDLVTQEFNQMQQSQQNWLHNNAV
jgi:hypothetical protein